MWHRSSRVGWVCAATAALLLAAGCSSGSGGSSVGSGGNSKPIARALVVNSGASRVVREGAEVLLTARDSEDLDGPLLDWSWTAPAGIQLLQRTRTTASFTAPGVAEPTTFTFGLTVFDSDNLTDTTTIDVTVVPAADPDRFLSPRAAQHAPSDAFTLTPALRPGAGAGPMDAPFTVYVEALVRYIGRSGAVETFELDLEQFALPIEGVWPAGEAVSCTAGQSDAACMLASHVSPSFRFRVPRLDIVEINQALLEAGEPNRQIDQHMNGFATLEISALLDAGALQDQAVLLVSAAGQVVAESSTSVIGIPASVTVSAEQLLAALPGEESAMTADLYYRTVDPLYRRTTLNQWLWNAGFAADYDGTLLPEAIAGDEEFAHVRFTNNFDLGFGRDMYTRVDPSGDVYAFVVNYPTLEAALKGTDEIVTVAMEFTPPDDPSLHPSCLAKGRFVKFFTFAPDKRGDSQRIGSMNFDGRGDRHTPGNCATCHGGVTADLDELETGSWGQPVYRNCGDTSSAFMPWDLDAFLYSDDDPAIVHGAPRPDGTPLAAYLDPAGRWTRAAQEEQFRKANEAALSTYRAHVAEGGDPERVAAAIELVHGWYGDRPDVPGTEFNGAYTPAGWNVSPEVAEVYHESYARYCRACHSLRPAADRQFRSYDDLVIDPVSDRPRELEELIFRRGIMPLARLTMDRFWVPFDAVSRGAPSAAERLAALLAADPRLSFDPSARPGRAVFKIRRTPEPVKEQDIVRLSAVDSGFVDEPRWTALAATDSGICVEPTLIAPSTLEVSFRATTAGRYCIELASGADRTVVEFEVATNQAPQHVAKSPFTIDESAGPTAIDLEYADADHAASELIYTLQGILHGVLSLDGAVLSYGDTFTQQQIDQGRVRFQPMLGVNLAAGVLVAGGIDYSLTDGTAVLGSAGLPLRYGVDIRGVNDGQPTISVAPVEPSELAFGGSVVIGADKISVTDLDSSAASLTISASLTGTPAGTITPATRTYQQLLNGMGFTYTHAGLYPLDLTDQIRFTVSDETLTSSPALMSVNARVSFRQNISAVIGVTTDAAACASCHNSTGGGLPNYLQPGDVDASYAPVRARVDLPETACTNASSPSGRLLAKPTATTAHGGGLRPGFDLAPGAQRDYYELFRAWICSFDAADN